MRRIFRSAQGARRRPKRSIPEYVSIGPTESNAAMGEKDKQRSGDNGGEDPPVPISNTEVKLPSAEDTWREAARENRTLPVLLKSRALMRSALYGPMVKRLRHRPFTAVTRVRFPNGSFAWKYVIHRAGCGSVWLERLIWVQEAAGSSPVTPTMWVTSSVGRALDF